MKRPRAVLLAVAVSTALSVLYLMAALWSPIPNLPLAVVMAAIVWGLRKGDAWGGYGGALLLAAICVGRVFTAATDVTLLAAAVLLFGISAVILFRAARKMPQTRSPWRIFWISLSFFAFAVSLLYQPYRIPSASMENTLFPGDYVLVRSVAVGSVARGQLTAYRPPNNPSAVFIGRVIALPGDRLRIVAKRLYLNGVEQKEPYAVHKAGSVDQFRDNFPSPPTMTLPDQDWTELLKRKKPGDDLVVPPDRFFLMGDNRDNALDSRYIGFLEQKDFIGKPEWIYFSAEPPGDKLTRNSFPAPVLLHPGEIRWTRILRPI